ncbi:MAG: isopentenyl phosphate kinase [Euryarchaeota archaeon]
MIILKLGGSIITDKAAKEPTVNHNHLNRIAREIKNSNTSDLIIVHGAGSYGHPFAREYSIGKPFYSDEDFQKKRMGFAITQSWVKKLNSIVCDALREQSVPAISIQPSSFITTENKRINKADISIVDSYLKKGFIPVIYGDVVLDEDPSIQMAVVSGDQIISYLAKNLLPERVILGTDVDGVFNKNPKLNKDSRIIETLSSLQELDSVDATTTVDVTGGMIGKLEELLKLAQLGIESEIINAGCNNLIEEALKGKKVPGTVIKK